MGEGAVCQRRLDDCTYYVPLPLPMRMSLGPLQRPRLHPCPSILSSLTLINRARGSTNYRCGQQHVTHSLIYLSIQNTLEVVHGRGNELKKQLQSADNSWRIFKPIYVDNASNRTPNIELYLAIYLLFISHTN